MTSATGKLIFCAIKQKVAIKTQRIVFIPASNNNKKADKCQNFGLDASQCALDISQNIFVWLIKLIFISLFFFAFVEARSV